MRIPAGAVLLLLACGGRALAQVPNPQPVLDPSIETVLSGCYWQAKGADSDGVVRVIVRSGGVEHLISDLWVDWIATARTSEDSASIVASMTFPNLNNTYSAFSNVRLRQQAPGRCLLTLDVTDTHRDVFPTDRWTIVLAGPGQGRVAGKVRIKAAKGT